MYVRRWKDAGEIATLRNVSPRTGVVVDPRGPILDPIRIRGNAHRVVANVLHAVSEDPVELGGRASKADLRADDAIVHLRLKVEVGGERVRGQGIGGCGCSAAIQPE